MTKTPLFSLPHPSTAVRIGPTLTDGDQGLRLSLTCDDDGEERSSTIVFSKARAYRQRAESYCTAWHVADTYDTVCEVGDSEWVAELKRDAVPEWKDRFTMRHFIIFVDGFGCLEVVAESATLGGDSSMAGRSDDQPISDVLWPDAEIASISIDYHGVAIALRESTGRQRTVTCHGHIGCQLAGFWDEVVVERAELKESDPFLTECLRVIASAYDGPAPDTGDPARNKRSWRILLVHLGNGAVLRIVASAFTTN